MGAQAAAQQCEHFVLSCEVGIGGLWGGVCVVRAKADLCLQTWEMMLLAALLRCGDGQCTGQHSAR